MNPEGFVLAPLPGCTKATEIKALLAKAGWWSQMADGLSRKIAKLTELTK